ncbi:MAG: tetratricopeptide repeat protein [Nitrospirae bacterium]|nr:tetratricopeptide repeat protein [Nitrospirota bacterium]
MKFRSKLLFLSVLVICFAASCAGMSKEERAQKTTAHYQLGVSYLNDNNIQPAFVEFQKALELSPDDKEVLNGIGVIYLLKLEDYPKAIEYFQKALRSDKNFSEAENNLGFAYEKMERYGEAILSYKAALANPLYRNAEKAFNNLGRAYYRLKKYNDSLDAYRESIRRSSDFHLPYYGFALCYNALGRYGDAATALRKAIELDPAYRGDRDRATKDLREKKLLLRGPDERDVEDLLEIMNY